MGFEKQMRKMLENRMGDITKNQFRKLKFKYEYDLSKIFLRELKDEKELLICKGKFGNTRCQDIIMMISDLEKRINQVKKEDLKMSVKIKIANWLAKKNGISQYMKGVIKNETEKAILFAGNAYAEKRINCMRCGRKLTHPSSRLVGFGPICCKHLGINWPDKDELTKKEIEEVKKKIEKISYKGWLPKSQVEIEGDYEIVKNKKVNAKIGLHARELKDGTIKKKGVAIKSPYSHKDLCEKVRDKFSGKWNSKRRYWQYPLQIEVVEYAEKLWNEKENGIQKSELLKKWYKKEKDKKKQLISTKAKKEVKPEELNTDLAKTLYDFQRIGTQFLTKADGAILGDDMGLGKTIQSIAAVDNIGAKNILIVCPASLRLNWRNEIEKWLDSKYNYSVLSGSKEKRLKALKNNANFYITNYASIRQKSRTKKDGDWVKIDNPIFKELKNEKWDIIIFDEAHRLKNRKSQQTKAAYKLCSDAKKVYHLTGTPIMNSPEEIWSLLHSLDKQKFSSFWRFVYQYCEVTDNGFGKEIGKAKNPKEFRELLKPYLLRRMKEDVIEDMPELTVNQQWLELEEWQNKIYKQMQKRMVAQLSEQEEVAAPVIIAKIMRMKQIVVSPELLKDKPSVKEFKKSAKIKALIDILSGSGEQKVVIFTQFKKAANLLASVLKNKNISFGLITGDVDKDKRQEAVNEFQNGNKKAFIATIKAGGLGINLTKGSIAVFLDKDWTPANNSQAVDRLHRIGQENNVTVIELLAKNTIEEYIEDLLEEKQKTFDSLIEGKITGKEVLMNLKDKMEGK